MKALMEYRWFIILFFCSLLFTLITDFNGLYGQDSYEYLRYTKCLYEFLRHGTNPGDFFWPLFYPVCGAILSFIAKPVFALQLISILSFTGIAIYLKKLIMEIYKPEEKAVCLFVLLAFVVSPYMLRASLVIMSDSLCVFFVTAAFYHYVKYQKAISAKHLVWFAVCTVAAVNTRYGAFVLLVVPSVIMAYTFIRNFNIKTFLIVLTLTIVLLLPHLFLRSKHPLAFINHDWLKDWSFANYFKTSFVNANGEASYSMPNIVYGFYNFFHPAFCFAGIILAVFSIFYFRKNKPDNIIPVTLSILLYALFIAGMPLQNLRFLQLSFPLAALLLFSGYLEFRDKLTWFKKPFVRGIYLLTALIQLAGFYRCFLSFYHDNQVEKSVAKAVLKYPRIPIYTFSIDGALTAYGVQNKIVNLYNIKLDSNNMMKGEKLILCNDDQLYQGDIPPIVIENYEYLRKHCKQNKIEDLEGRWYLYKAD